MYSGANGAPALTSGPPPCTFNARTVATITITSGTKPLDLHLILMNLSPPMVKSKPASVTTYPSCSFLSSGVKSLDVPANFKAILSAKIEDAPMEMLAKGPA